MPTNTKRPFHLVDADWAWAQRLLRSRKKQLLGIPGVLSAELGYRVRHGVLTTVPCITVCVRRKTPGGKLKRARQRMVPRIVRAGRHSLPVDVIALGTLKRQAECGDSIGPQGRLRTGTLGALAIDTVSRRTVAITAMHVSGLSEVPSGTVQNVPFCRPSRQDSAQAPVFATLVRGTTSGIDAAKLDVSSQPDPMNAFPGGRAIVGWRPTSYPGDRGTAVHMCGARSGVVAGYIVNPYMPLPEWDLDAAILVNIESMKGDSGAALIDSNNLLLGFLVGAGGKAQTYLRIFVPAGLVFDRLGCDLPTVR